MRIIESDQKDIIRKRGPIKEGEGIHARHAFICAGQNGLVTCICTGHWARDMYLCLVLVRWLEGQGPLDF